MQRGVRHTEHGKLELAEVAVYVCLPAAILARVAQPCSVIGCPRSPLSPMEICCEKES